MFAAVSLPVVGARSVAYLSPGIRCAGVEPRCVPAWRFGRLRAGASPRASFHHLDHLPRHRLAGGIAGVQEPNLRLGIAGEARLGG